MRKTRVLIFIVAYNAERTIQPVLARIPVALLEYDTEILIIDDSSCDETFHRAREFGESPFPITVLFNPVNQGYGGNQKIGFHFAIRKEFDFVALVHGDGQYAPECLPELLLPLANKEADAVFGSRMMSRADALRGGMPLYKYVGNRILTSIQNRLLHSSLSEFHSGYRLYSVEALRRIPFQRNTNDFHFDTEIIIQLFRAGLLVRELPIPTYYGDEICRVNGLKYAFNVVKATLLARAHDVSLLHQRKYDVAPVGHANYQPKFGYESPHSLALESVAAGSAVADIGCASGYMARELKRKNCTVTGIDQFPISRDVPVDHFIQHDLNEKDFPVEAGSFDYILLLDVIEHLQSPESFVDALRSSCSTGTGPKIVVSTGNIAFFVTRFMLLSGFFNYGRRGILDITHTRLFTFGTMQALFEQAGYVIAEVRGVPAPFPLAIGDNCISRFLIDVNKLLIKLSRPLFSYQIFMIVRPLPTLEELLESAIEFSHDKVSSVQVR
jgi:glycosyltransferase involved in cell wall biosynthesis